MKFYLCFVLINIFYYGFASRVPSLKPILTSGEPSTERSLTEEPSTVISTMHDADQPLNVIVTQIGDNYAVFNITGNSTVQGLPIVDLHVAYSIDGESTLSKVKPISQFYSNNAQPLQELVKIPDLKPGHTYHFKFMGENSEKALGPPSRQVNVLLLPPTPDITVEHPNLKKLIVKWNEHDMKSEDYYLLTIEKKSALGCGITLNITSCYGNKYSFDDLDVGQVYKLTMRAHNPTGFSEPVVVSYPID